MPKRKVKKANGLRKNQIGGKIMTKFVGLRAKKFSYLIHDGSKGKKCVMKTKLKFQYYKNCLEAIQLENKTNYLEKIKITKIINNSQEINHF